MKTNQHHLLKLAELNFTNRLKQTCPHLFIKVQSSPIQNPVLLHTNTDLLNRLEIDPYEMEKASFVRFINGDLEFDGLIFGSTYYSGHQFGYYVPRLGDGRAIMLAEVETSYGEHFELQLKGAGLTPFSRMGDGRAVVRSSVREYLASAHLKALSIPTTEALAIIHGSDDVYRETVEKSSIVMRVAQSFLRFGHFEYLAHTKQKAELQSLVDFVIATYFKQYNDHPNRTLLFYQDVVKKTAMLFAKWQAVGFCHGVLNTDNMSILGLTIDYGPYGFIDDFNLDFICNHSDHEGRYSYGNQPSIGMWNLEQLGRALVEFIQEEDRERTLNTYPQLFHFEYRRLLREKMGLLTNQEKDEDLMRDLFTMLLKTKIDYTNFFRALSHYQLNQSMPFEKSEELDHFLNLYNERLKNESTNAEERRDNMLAINPKFILRNWVAQHAIDNVTTNPMIMDQIFKVLTSPFSEHSEFEDWSKPAPVRYRNLTVSCSS
jgi:uncharacterized protein YdiU (UPF0061 family)